MKCDARFQSSQKCQLAQWLPTSTTVLFQCVRMSLKSVNSAGLSGSGRRAFDGSRTFFSPPWPVCVWTAKQSMQRIDHLIGARTLCAFFRSSFYFVLQPAIFCSAECQRNKLDIWICICIYLYMVMQLYSQYIYIPMYVLHLYMYIESISRSICGSRAQPSRGTEYSNAGK